MRIPAYFVFAHFFLVGVLSSEPALVQRPRLHLPADSARTMMASQSNSSVDLDIYLRGPDGASLADTAALTLFTAAGQLYKQGVTKKGHLRWDEVARAKYEIQVLAPGFERAVQPVDPSGAGALRVDVQLRPQTGGERAYPPPASDAEVNYVFGLYASRSGDWEQAKSYWARTLELLPDHVSAMVSMSEALLHENKALEAMEYLVRAEKIDPAYWRTQAVLAEIALRAGSTAEAVLHAERAMELGHEEAASAAPLLARALAARADEVLRTYLKDHPEDVAARKQLEDLHAPSEVRTSSEQPKADSREKSSAAASAKPAPRPGDTLWLPPDVDENVPPVEPGAACNLEEVLERAGKRIQEFVGNVDRFTATEFLQHETLARSGNVTATQKRKYDYVVSITEVRPGVLDLQEYESSGSTPADAPGGMTTRGLPALVLIFHPYYSGTFAMKCEGLATWNGTRTWQVYFRQREDQPNKIRAYRIGLENYPVALKGRAWIVADSYQILGVQTDLIAGVPDIRLTAEHTAIQYGPVHFASRGVDMWLPQTAEVYSERKGKRIHRRLSFTNYLLFAVDEKQQIATPNSNP